MQNTSTTATNAWTKATENLYTQFLYPVYLSRVSMMHGMMYFFIAVQTTHIARSIWIALAGQPGQSGLQ